jgi:hypothetical protein
MLPADEKGKVFTDVVRTQQVKVVIQTYHNKIRGLMHKPKEDRLIDKLNQADKFLPVTQVVIFDEFGKEELHRTDFLAINCNEIVWLFEGETGADKK